MTQKPRLAASLSGGRSSAVAYRRCLDLYGKTHEIKTVFLNTGSEHPATLDFVDAINRHWANGSVVWVEAVINPTGEGVSSKVVNYETADRNNGPMKAAIEKYGVFCPTHPNCTARLKGEPFRHYLESVGWEPGSYDTAIGIRADEADRMSPKRKEQRLIYPLVTELWRKQDVNDYMAQFDWDLKLPNDAFGNCVWCWKKSLRKLMTVAKTDPSFFDFPGEMERRHGNKTNGKAEQKDNRVFFRDRLSAQDIVKMAFTEEFTPYTDKADPQGNLFNPLSLIDLGGGCGDSCEIGAD